MKEMPKCYFYKFVNGRLKVKEGYISGYTYRSSHEMKFQYGKKYHEWNRCHPEAGEIMNGGLWLPERDDKKARDIFIEHYESCIKGLEERIANYRTNIEILNDA